MSVLLPFRLERRWLAFGHDAIMAALAFLLALYLRLGEGIWGLPVDAVFLSTMLFTVTCAVVFLANGLYRGIWAFASVHDLSRIVRAVSIATAAYALIGFLVTRLEYVPRTVPFISWFILLAVLGGARLSLRLLRERRLSALWQRVGGGRTHVLIVGAGEDADLFIRATNNDPQSPFRVVGVVGENDRRVGRMIHGVEVLGTLDSLPAIVETLRRRDLGPSRLILTRSLTRMNGTAVTRLFEQCGALGLTLSRLPPMTDLRDADGSGAPRALRDQPIALEDLLGRPEIVLDKQAIGHLVRGRRVLVTGAGGSIGSELVRQIAALEPSHIALLDSGEFNLYRIDMEVSEHWPALPRSGILADVRDAARLDRVFSAEKPDLVFHAAAIKHVPIAEANAREAILTNAIGTRNVADAALKAGVAVMTLISTDKAVRPANVMGAAKRLAEMYCQALDSASGATRFVTVRFGNVLGSTGSVVPRFHEQLAKGGPLTVTHPDITRYFMTIREAVELVLQATALGAKPGDQRGKVLVLDMGRPIKIADLARLMIRLAGLRPDEDVSIAYTGLRPGEKLHEELFSEDEHLLPTAAEGVHMARSPAPDLTALQQELNTFAASLETGMADASSAAQLARLVPEFQPQTIAA